MSSIALARVYQQSFDAHPYYTLAFTNGALNALGDVVAQVTQRAVRPPRSPYLGYPLILPCRSNPWNSATTTACASTLSAPHASLRLGWAWVSLQRPPPSTKHAQISHTGPIIGRWNFFLERHFPLRAPMFGGKQGKVSLWALGKRVAADQLLMCVVSSCLTKHRLIIVQGARWPGPFPRLNGHHGGSRQATHSRKVPRSVQAAHNRKLGGMACCPGVFLTARLRGGECAHARLLQLVNFRFMPLPYRVPFQSSCGVFWTLYLSLVNSRYVCPAEACVTPVSHDATERTRKRIAAMLSWKPASGQHKAQRELKASLHLPSTYPYFVHGQSHQLHEQHRPTYDSLPLLFHN